MNSSPEAGTSRWWQFFKRHKNQMRPYRSYIKDDNNFKPLSENRIMLLGHVFETAYIVNKITNEESPVFQFYGDPTCGLLGKYNDWCLAGGEMLILMTWVDNSVRSIGELKNIHSLKAIDDYKAQILIDPWSEASSIWEIEIDLNKLTRPFNLYKLKDFKDYVDKPYTEEVFW